MHSFRPRPGGEGALYQGADRTGNLCYIFLLQFGEGTAHHGPPTAPGPQASRAARLVHAVGGRAARLDDLPQPVHPRRRRLSRLPAVAGRRRAPRGRGVHRQGRGAGRAAARCRRDRRLPERDRRRPQPPRSGRPAWEAGGIPSPGRRGIHPQPPAPGGQRPRAARGCRRPAFISVPASSGSGAAKGATRKNRARANLASRDFMHTPAQAPPRYVSPTAPSTPSAPTPRS